MMTMAIRRGGAHDPEDPNPGTLALRAGAGLLAAIHHFLPPGERARVQIKWPNDILLDGKKLAGILVEADPRWFYVGFGVNSFPPESMEDELYTEGVRSAESADWSSFTCVYGRACPAPPPATLRSLSGIPEVPAFLHVFDKSFLTALHGDFWRQPLSLNTSRGVEKWSWCVPAGVTYRTAPRRLGGAHRRSSRRSGPNFPRWSGDYLLRRDAAAP